MYTYNLFCFGHELKNDTELNNLLWRHDVEFNHKIGNREYEINFPYHGGQISGDVFSCVFGTIITDDDGNPHYIDEVRLSREDDYINEYNQFLDILLKSLDEDVELEPSFKDVVDKLRHFLSNNKPKFYSVEASS